MSVQQIQYKDSIVQDVLENPNGGAIIWYLMAGYCYWEKKSPIISDLMFDKLEGVIVKHWKDIKNPLKGACLHYSDVCAGSSFCDFSKVPQTIKFSAHMHITELHGENPVKIRNPLSKKKDTTPAVSTAATLHKNQAVAHIRIEARVWLASPNNPWLDSQKSVFKQAAEQCGFDYWGGLAFSTSGQTRAKTSAALLRLLTKLKSINAPVREYRLTEVLIDSAVKDVWKLADPT